MSSRIDTDRMYRLTEASAVTPGRPHLATMFRWVAQGVLRNGERRRLPATKIGGRLFVLGADLAAFLDLPEFAAAPKPRTPAQRNRAAEQAELELEKLGV